MKKTLLLLASAALLLVGCAKEKLGPDAGSGEMVTANFTAQMQGMPQTKSVTDGEGTKATRCVMEIYYQGVLYTRDVKLISEMKATFTPKLVSNRTYDVLFWADCGGENLADKYYKTNAEGLGLQAVEMKTTAYAANDDARDAFYTTKSVPVGQQVSSETFTLTRPFSQVNIITTDAAVIKNANLYPDGVKMVYKAPTKFNLLTKTLSEEKELTVTGAPYEAFDATSPALTLEMDYLFTGEDKSALDIAFEASKTGEATTTHSFTNIPVQRNYRTNIKGALLTTTGDWTATIAPAWTTPAYDVPFLSASTITEAQNYIAPDAQGTQTVKVVDLSKATISTTDIKGDDKKIEFRLKTTSPADMVNFALPEIPQDVLEAGCTGWKITYDDGYPTQNVNVTAPEGTSVTIEAPNSHVTLNGELYEQVTATTSQSTLVVPAGVTVDKLIVKEGAVEIHGVVNNLTVSPAQGKTVVFKDCENLGDDVYAVAKQHIAEGYVADDATNSIVKKDFVQDENGVWHVMNAKAYNEFTAAVNGGTTFEGQTVVLDADIDFQNATVAPIGNQSDNKPFKGTFNGNNKKLSNVTVQNIVGKQGVGIFGKVYAPCVIKDLTVESATVIGDKTTAGDKAIAYVGGIAGHGYATIQNCTFKGNIYAGHQIGGIAGSGGFTITGCTFEGNIISERYWGLGGIIGNCQDGGAISENTAKGTISAKGSDPLIAGGIIGAPLYTTYDVKNNYASMSMTYNGEPFENVYPIVGVYNEDQPKTETDFAKLTATLANNTWDKTISPNESYAILYHSSNLTPTGYLINYGAATTKAPVAKIGDTEYETLQAAFNAVPDGIETTITLNADATTATLGDKNHIGAKTVILNLNGHNITGYVSGITDLTGYTSLNGATLVNFGNLTINGEGTIGDLEGEYHHNALVNISNGTNLTINGGTFVAKSCCVFHYSASSQANTASINVTGGNFKSYENAATNKYVFGIGGKSGQILTFNYCNAKAEASAEGAKGIYCSLAGTTINVHSGSITANINAIYLSSGKNVTINIDGGTLETLDSENHANNYNSNGSYCGSSLPIYASASGSENIVCNISGGIFKYPYYSYQLNGTIPATWERVINAGVGITSNVANANIKATLTGGTYSTNQMLSDITNPQSEASGIVAQGYTCKDNGDGTWTVVAEN